MCKFQKEIHLPLIEIPDVSLVRLILKQKRNHIGHIHDPSHFFILDL